MWRFNFYKKKQIIYLLGYLWWFGFLVCIVWQSRQWMYLLRLLFWRLCCTMASVVCHQVKIACFCWMWWNQGRLVLPAQSRSSHEVRLAFLLRSITTGGSWFFLLVGVWVCFLDCWTDYLWKWDKNHKINHRLNVGGVCSWVSVIFLFVCAVYVFPF